jgi:hypothetical protein
VSWVRVPLQRTNVCRNIGMCRFRCVEFTSSYMKNYWILMGSTASIHKACVSRQSSSKDSKSHGLPVSGPAGPLKGTPPISALLRKLCHAFESQAEDDERDDEDPHLALAIPSPFSSSPFDRS